jgi:hypothetical protein
MPGMWAIGSRGSRSIGRDLGPSRQVCSQNPPNTSARGRASPAGSRVRRPAVARTRGECNVNFFSQKWQLPSVDGVPRGRSADRP